MLEIKLNVATANIRRHSDYWCSVNPPDYTARGDTVKVRHNNVHQDDIVFRTLLYFINSFKAVELEFFFHV